MIYAQVNVKNLIKLSFDEGVVHSSLYGIEWKSNIRRIMNEANDLELNEIRLRTPIKIRAAIKRQDIEDTDFWQFVEEAMIREYAVRLR